ncbi:MAG: septum formation inhibitor Maf [Proteobacteria bacterium]|nr:septum formation inhibitor Maf [Pseudomonadota bacterium]
MTLPPIHLASSSPRRKEILRAMGLRFTAGRVDVDEQRHDGEAAHSMVLRLAAAKAGAADVAENVIVIGADTAVVLGGEIFGKPRDRQHGLEMLAALSGQTHEVLTGVAVRSPAGIFEDVSTTEVRFREISPDEALAYWHSGESRDKAGAYAIQGRGGVFVESIVGSYSGVVGLPVYETGRLLEQAGFDSVLVLRQGDIDGLGEYDIGGVPDQQEIE